MSKNKKAIHEAFEKIEIPANLNSVISDAILRGRKEMKKRSSFTGLRKIALALVGLFLLVSIGINQIPAFADGISTLPGGGKLVKILYFGKDESKDNLQGGEITDGTDIKFISWNKGEGYETLTIDFSVAGAPTYSANYFEVTYKEYPYSMTVAIPGARGISAANSFPAFEGSQLARNIYRIITLDDSMERFVVTFKRPVKLVVREYQAPAKVVIEFREEEEGDSLRDKYSLRSKSYPFGEEVGVIEEILTWEVEGSKPRMLQDKAGTYLVEEGLYDSEPEALARQQELKMSNLGVDFIIEKRGANELPRVIH